MKVTNSYEKCSGMFMIRNYLSDLPDIVLQIFVVEFDVQVNELARHTKVSSKLNNW